MSAGRKALVTAINVAKLKYQRTQRDQRKYADMVLSEFDRLERADVRELADKRAEVERKARNAL